MSITVRDCLRLPTLSLGHVSAGKNGLDNIINHVDVIEFVLEGDDFATPNTLFITAFHAIRDSADAQCRALYIYKRLGASAVVLFYSGLVVHRLDPKVIQTADELNLPIIELPGNDLGLHYCDVIEEVMESIFIDRKDHQNVLGSTLDMVSQLPPDRQNIRTLLEYASGFVKSSLFLCDRTNRLIASAYWPRNNVNDPFPDIILRFADQKMTDTISVAQLSPEKTCCYRQFFTVKPQTDLILYSSCRNNVMSSSAMDQITEMIRLFISIWNYNLDFSNRNSLLTLLLTGNYELAEQLSSDDGLRLSEYDTLLIAEQPLEHTGALQESIQSALSELCSPGSVLFEATSERAIILINSSALRRPLPDPKTLPEALCCRYITFGEHFDPFSLQEFYTRYCDSIEAATKIFRGPCVFTSCQISFTDWCLSLNKGKSAGKTNYLAKLRPLLVPKHAETLETLATYLLDANSEIKKTSELLYIHRNTVQHRLQKVRELIALDATTLPDSYTLYVATALHRISPTNG